MKLRPDRCCQLCGDRTPAIRKTLRGRVYGFCAPHWLDVLSHLDMLIRLRAQQRDSMAALSKPPIRVSDAWYGASTGEGLP